jgi:hypothetical protein
MNKILVPFAVAASALVAVAPAAAQWAPPPPQPYYGQGYNQRANVNHGQFRSLQARIDRAQRQIERLDRRDHLSNREARRLRDLARDVRNDFFRASRDGLNYNELRRFEVRVADLELRIQREARDGNRYNDRRLTDRDRDGRPDRWEDDRGRDRDD